MADRIKGITIEIGGDTKGLKDALSGVNSEIRNTQSQLKDVERLLKLDPSNTELLQQKQKLLTAAVGETKSKLDTLKEASRQAAETASNYDAWKEKYDPIKTKIDETKKKLNELKEQSKTADEQLSNGEISQEKYDALQNEIKETSKELRTLQQSAKEVSDEFGNPISPEQYDALQREIVETEQRLQSLERQASNANVTLQQIGAAGEKFKATGEKITAVGQKLLPVTAAITGIGTAAVKTTADFDEAMSQVAAISGATGTDFDALRDKAREMGEKTKFSATEAAEAFTYMAMAGWDVEQMLNGIDGVMNLSAADGLDLATTSDIVTDAMTAFGLSAKETYKILDDGTAISNTAHFADVLAKASSSANTNVSMLGESFKYVAPVAGSLSYSVEDTAVALGLMANAGIKSSQAGTALRTMLTNMVNPTDKMADAMNYLGVSLDDDEGNMLSLMDVMKQLRKGMGNAKMSVEEFTSEADYLEKALKNGTLTQKKYSEKMEDLINKTYGAEGATKAMLASQLAGKEGMSGLLAIVNTSEEEFNKLAESIYNADGAARTMADVRLDNLSGQLTILKSQLQEAAISIGDTLIPTIKDLVSMIQEWVDWFNSLDQSQKEMVVTIGMVVAAVGPMLIAFGQMSVGLGSLMDMISKTGSLLTLLGGPAGILFVTAASAAALGAAFILAKDNTVDYYEEAVRLTDAELKNRDAIDSLMDSYNRLASTREGAVTSIDSQAQYERKLWEELQSITDANGKIQEGNEDRAAFITSTLADALGIEIDNTGEVIKNYQELQGEIDGLILKKQAEAVQNAYQAEFAEAVKNSALAEDELAAATVNAKAATDKYNEAVEKQNGLQEEYDRLLQELDSTADDASYDRIRQQLYDLSDQMITNGETIDGLRDHMDQNNQAWADAQEQVDRYNTVIANYEGVSSAILTGEQEKISEALFLLQNDFMTTETATRESLEAQYRTIVDKLTDARTAIAGGSAGFSDSYIPNLERMEKEAAEQLKQLPVDTGNAANDAVEAVRVKEPYAVETGKYFANGLAKGISAGEKDVMKAIESLADDAVSKLKVGFQVRSPSKITKEIGSFVDAGLKEGIEEGAGEVTEVMERLAFDTVSRAKSGLDKAAFADTGKQIALGLSEGITLGKSDVLASVQLMCLDVINSARERLGIHSPSEEFAYLGLMSGEGYVNGWLEKQAEIEASVQELLGTVWTEAGAYLEEEAEKAVKPSAEALAKEMTGAFDAVNLSLLALRDSSGEAIANVVTNMWEAQEALQEIQDSLESTITGQISMFDEFDGEVDMSTNKLLENMQSQVKGTEQWSENLRKLAERGIDQGLLQKLAEMGPKGAGYVTIFSQMTDQQLQKANALFAETMTLPVSTAESIMESYRLAGTMMGQGFADGIQENAEAAVQSSEQIATDAAGALETALDINSPSRVTMELGGYFAEGFAEGITNNTQQAMTAAQQMSGAAAEQLTNSLKQLSTDTQSYQITSKTGWTSWKNEIAAIFVQTFSEITTTAETGMTNVQAKTQNGTDAIRKDWKQKWEDIKISYKNNMAEILQHIEESMQKASETTAQKTEEMKDNSNKSLQELSAGAEEELGKLEPAIRAGFDPGIKYITGLSSDFRTWGNHMMQGLIQGLEDYLDELEDMCEEIADTISDNLHFTRPERGSLRNYEEWMPHFMQGLAKGIADNRYLVLEQIRGLTEEMSGMINMSEKGQQPIIVRSVSQLVLDSEIIAEVVNEGLGAKV